MNATLGFAAWSVPMMTTVIVAIRIAAAQDAQPAPMLLGIVMVPISLAFWIYLIAAIAGAHRISVGALTHSVPALDLSMDLEQHGVRLRAVAFGGGDWMDELKSASRGSIAVAFQPVLNEFRGRTSVEMHLADWRPEE